MKNPRWKVRGFLWGARRELVLIVYRSFGFGAIPLWRVQASLSVVIIRLHFGHFFGILLSFVDEFLDLFGL